MALNQLFNSPLLSKSPKLRQNKISAAKISPLKSFKIDTDVLRAPSIPRPGEGVKEPNLILRELVETNTILREVQKQLAIDFANRILEKEKDLKLQKSLLAKRRGKDKEDSIEGKIGKDTSFLKKSFDKVTKPIKGIFDRIKDFLTALALAITATAAFEWLKDPANRERLEKFFNWVGEHWKWIVGIIAGGLLLKGLLDILGAIGGIAALTRGLGLGRRGIGNPLNCFPVADCGPVWATATVFALNSAIIAAAIKAWPFLKGLKDRVFEIPDWVTNPIPNPALAIAKIQEVVDRIKTKVGDLATEVASVTAGVFSGSVLDALASEFYKRFIQDLLVDPSITAYFATTAWVTSMVDATMTQAKKTWSQVVGVTEAVKLYLKERLDAVGDWLQAWEPPKIEVDWYDVGSKLQGLAWSIVGFLLKGVLQNIGRLLLGDLLPAAAKGGTVSDILARQEFSKGGPVRKKKSCCKSCMGFSAGKFEEGGKTKGPSHAQGGIPIEVEGGEFITKASSVNPLTEPLLRDINDNGARMWTSFAGAVEKQGQNNLKQMEINNDFSDFLKKYRNVAAGINPGAVHGMGGPDPETPLKLKPFSSSTLTTGEQVPSELLELGTIWKDGILRHKETDKPFTYADLYKIIDSRVSSDIKSIEVIPYRDSNTTNLKTDRVNTTVINDTKAEQVIPISSGDTRVETTQRSGSRGTDNIVIQTYDVDNEWILATMSAYDITGYVGAII